ncbi:hypothetical protein N9D77_03240 [Paracoccaceae bacterium]|nr:hypothetical protein [Paracoccaceae bacterium]
MALCIIPARGGSKRLPNKNILPFKKKPMISNVIDNVIRSGVFDDVVVSSDSDEILDISESAGAKKYKREDSIAQDTSTVVDVCLDLLKHYQTKTFCCIYPTAVLFSSETIIKSFDTFQRYGEAEASVLMGVARYNYHPAQALIQDEIGNWRMLLPDFLGIQSQKYPEARVSSGTFYWARSETFICEKTFYSKKLKVFDLGLDEALDIDTSSDYRNLIEKHDTNWSA